MSRINKTIRFLRRSDILISGVVGGMLFGLFAGALVHYRLQPLPEVTELRPIVVFPDFTSIQDVSVKKQMFFDFLELYIDEENLKVKASRQQLLALSDIATNGVSLSPGERNELLSLAISYHLEFEGMQENQIVFELLKRVDAIPVSLALAQAANESAWGTSRFALEANNIFGQWCYKEGCGLVPNRRAHNASHEVRSFASIEDSVKAYFMNLNTHNRYEGFRDMRYQMRNQRGELDPLVLAYALGGYSERGEKYVDEVQTIIQQNDLINKYKI